MQNLSNQSRASTTPNKHQILTLLLRSFFKLLYHQLAWTYDWVAAIVSAGAWRRWIESIVPYIEKQPTLEIGFGPGHLQIAMHRSGVMIYGLDESAQMNRMASKRMSKHGMKPSLVRGDAHSLPFAGLSFQQVVLTFPSEYILEPATLEEISRVLIKGGHVYILPLAWITGRSVVQRAAAWLNSVTGEAPPWNEKYMDHFRTPGFTVYREILDLGDSKVLLIKLEKTSSYQGGKPGS